MTNYRCALTVDFVEVGYRSVPHRLCITVSLVKRLQ